jgi:hypothetical protein
VAAGGVRDGVVRPLREVGGVNSQALQELATRLDGVGGKLRFAWVVEDDGMTTMDLIATGRRALSEVADRYEFVVFEDDWVIDGPMLRVSAVAVWWPSGDPSLSVTLFDDVASEVPAA